MFHYVEKALFISNIPLQSLNLLTKDGLYGLATEVCRETYSKVIERYRILVIKKTIKKLSLKHKGNAEKKRDSE